MTTMDFWYDLAIREPANLNEEAAERLRDADDGPDGPADGADAEDE